MTKTVENKAKKVDPKEFEYPETVYSRDIENRVFQTIVLHALEKIEGIRLLESNFIDNILRKTNIENLKGIHTEQDSSKHAVSVRVEIDIEYGIPIPLKAEEIQNTISQEITTMTGLHVDCVHVIFKNIILAEVLEGHNLLKEQKDSPAYLAARIEDEYSEEF